MIGLSNFVSAKDHRSTLVETVGQQHARMQNAGAESGNAKHRVFSEIQGVDLRPCPTPRTQKPRAPYASSHGSLATPKVLRPPANRGLTRRAVIPEKIRGCEIAAVLNSHEQPSAGIHSLGAENSLS